MFQSILRPLSCSVDEQFLFRRDPKFLSSHGSYPFHLKSFIFIAVFKFKKKASIFSRFCKNQTKMKFLWQGSKIQIVSSFAHK